jgi:hypothetical protein
MRLSLVPPLCLLLLAALSGTAAVSPLEKGFSQPPDSTKPWVYWYWISGNVSSEGITHDLEAMKRVGIGEAFIGDVDALPNVRGPVKVMSAEWLGLVAHAIHEGKRLGVDIGLFNCPGWSQSGGPWVKAEQSMRYVTSTLVRLQGPVKFRGKLAAPAGAFQDIATLAYPAPAADADSLALHRPRVTATPALAGAAGLFEGPRDAAVTLPEGTRLTLEAETAEPFTVRSLAVYPGAARTLLECELRAADESGQFRTLRKFTVDRRNSELNVGPMRFGPVTITLPEVSSRRYQLLFSGAGALTGLQLSGAARVESFVEKQLGKMFQAPLPAWDSYLWPRAAEPTTGGLTVPRERVMNLTARLSPDGELIWDVPAGTWIVERLGMSPTGVRNAPALPEATGYEIDKMSRTLVAGHFQAYLGKVLERIPASDRQAWKHVVADSYEVGSQNWTGGFAADFQRRYGYEAIPFLPVLSGRIVGTADQSDRFLWDLRRLVADRISSGYVGGLRDLSEKHGMRLWLENYGHWGFAGESLQYGAASHEVAGEFWTSARLGSTVEVRAAASAAHVFGKPLVHCESFTTSGKPWILDPWGLKARGDWASAQGVNHVVLHVYTHQPAERKPGLDWWAGFEMNRHNTWFEQSTAWIDYQRRRDFLLQQGKYVADIAYFTGEDAPKMTGSRQPAPPAGHAFDDIDGQAILERVAVRDGRFTLPDGMSYRVLVLPPQETMRPELLRRIRDLVAAGGIVLGNPPSRSPSMEGYPQADGEVAALAQQLWKDCDGVTKKSASFGKGRVFRGLGLDDVFAQLDVPADVALSAPLLWLHRRTGEGDIYFLSNQSDAPVEVSAVFRVSGRRPELWDAVRGEHRDLGEFSAAQGGTRVPLRFAPREAFFVLFRQPAAAPANAGARNFEEPREAAELTGPWMVHFDPQWGGPETVSFDALTDWTARPEAGIRYYSGTAVYRKTFAAPAASGRRLYLDLGSVASLARVRLNGKDLGIVWCAPWRVEVTGAVRPEGNRLEIEVTNTWANRVIGDRDSGAGAKFAPTVIPARANATLQPAGLRGPVRLLSAQ